MNPGIHLHAQSGDVHSSRQSSIFPVESVSEEIRNMSMVFVLLPLSIILGGGALVLFLWALRNGQFDDLETPAHRILFEDEQP